MVLESTVAFAGFRIWGCLPFCGAVASAGLCGTECVCGAKHNTVTTIITLIATMTITTHILSLLLVLLL